MSSKSSFKKTGSFVGKGADKKIVLGFAPKYVKVVNLTDRITEEKFDTMAAATALHTVAAGTMTSDADAVVLNADGFTLKASKALNAKTFHYVAYEANNE